MANDLGLYVEKYLTKFYGNLPDNEDGNEDTKAVVTERIEGEEGANVNKYSVSKLRTQNAELLGDIDSRYEAKKTTRKDLKCKDEIEIDPELAKFCIIEDAESEDLSDSNSDEEKHIEASQSDENLTEEKDESDDDSTIEDSIDKNEDDYMRLGEEIDDNDSESAGDSEENEDDSEDGEDFEEDENTNNTTKYLNDKRKEEYTPNIITYSKEKSDQTPRGVAVKNQCCIYDSLFEARIGLQKAVAVANQLPQHYAYEEFLKNDYYPQYKSNLLEARRSVKKLISQILRVQDTLLSRNSETRNILIEKDHPYRDPNEDKPLKSNFKFKTGKKRKLEEFEENLQKRHKNLIQFRDETLTKWHEKSKLLGTQGKRNFDKFEIPPVEQLRNALNNKESLIKKTQLIGVARGNVYQILGKPQDKQDSNLIEEYDSEIFDDSDFYSRMLEDVLKSKISVSDDMTEVSRRWIDIQKLRKKAKKKVDTKASKGRKIRYEVMSKLQNFLAPCKLSQMSDEAQNQLFSSLFSKF